MLNGGLGGLDLSCCNEAGEIIGNKVQRFLASVGAASFLPPLDGPWLLQPFSMARNATFDGPVVWAIDRGARQNLDVVRHLSGRTPYRVLPGSTRRSPTRLQQLAVIDGRLVPVGLQQ